jgi:hypothetical protein
MRRTWLAGGGGVLCQKQTNSLIVQCSYRALLDVVDCTTPLLYILTPTCSGSSLPSSGSFLDPFELLEIRIEWVVYNIQAMCGHGSVC